MTPVEIEFRLARGAKAETALACATDIVNSWCRESGLPECRDPYQGVALRDAIDRLWSKLSGELASVREDAARLANIVGKECEFCGDPASRVEHFDREVYVCKECHAK